MARIVNEVVVVIDGVMGVECEVARGMGVNGFVCLEWW